LALVANIYLLSEQANSIAFKCNRSAKTGAYEPPKAAKERATPVYARVPSKYKFKQKLGNCASAGNAHGHRYTRITTPTVHGFVFDGNTPLTPLAAHMLLAKTMLLLAFLSSLFDLATSGIIGNIFHPRSI
jgi:hypothetical protein